MLQQISRISWLKKGDRNNKFYNQAIQKRNHRNGIKTIIVGDSLVCNPKEIKEAFLDHFQRLYNKNHSLIMGIGSCVERIISESETFWLEKEFKESEIELALSELASDKAPGPDGFNIHFIKFFGKNLKTQIMDCFRNFWANEDLPLGFNSSFNALIPKISYPKLIQDYRPISLINSTFKLLTKMLTNRLTALSSKIFDQFQFGFLKGR